jgi:predicted DsbA family dithiol-disulfide isomerase
MDKFEELNSRLKKIQETFEEWKNSGINEEILIIYLADKTGLGKKDIKALLKSQEQFFKDLIKDAVVDRLSLVRKKVY